MLQQTSQLVVGTRSELYELVFSAEYHVSSYIIGVLKNALLCLRVSTKKV